MDEWEARSVLGVARDAHLNEIYEAYSTRQTRYDSRNRARTQNAYDVLATLFRTVPFAYVVDHESVEMDAPLAETFEVIIEAARSIGDVDETFRQDMRLVLVQDEDPNTPFVLHLDDENTSYITVTAFKASRRQDEPLVAARLASAINKRLRELHGLAAQPELGDEIVLGVYVETDDEAVFRDVAKHVEELADHLGYGQTVRVG